MVAQGIVAPLVGVQISIMTPSLLSSVGRATALQAVGHWFKPSSNDHNGAVAQRESNGFASRRLRVRFPLVPPDI